MNIIEAASEWGQPPGAIAGDDDELLWLLRWQVYRRTVSKAQDEKARLEAQ